MKVGFIAGATTSALGKVGDMPSESISDEATKAAVAGAVGGLAVAASGGDEADIRKGFVLTAGMVLVQDAYKAETSKKLDPQGAEKGPYDKLTVGGKNSPPPESQTLDENGVVVKTDVSKMDPTASHAGIEIGEKSSPLLRQTIGESAPVMRTVSAAPIGNAASFLHDFEAAKYNLDPVTTALTIPHTFYFTALGTDGGILDFVEETNVKTAKREADRSSTAEQTQQ